MSWAFVAALSVGAYLTKAVGLLVLGRRHVPPALDRCLVLVPAALLPALIVQDTLSTGHELVADARVVGVAAAAVAAWRRAPLIVVIGLGAAVTALARRAGLD